MEDPYWQSFMEQAVRLIYFLAESPDQLCSRLLQRSARLLLDQIAEGGEGNREPDQVQEGSQETNEQGEQGECFIIIYFYYYLNHDNLKVDIFFFFSSLCFCQSAACVWPSSWRCAAAWPSGRCPTWSAAWAPSCAGEEGSLRRGRRKKKNRPAKPR